MTKVIGVVVAALLLGTAPSLAQSCQQFVPGTALPFDLNELHFEAAVTGAAISVDSTGGITLGEAVRVTPLKPMSVVALVFRTGSVPDLRIVTETDAGTATADYPAHSNPAGFASLSQFMNGVTSLVFMGKTANSGYASEQAIMSACPTLIP